MTNFFICFFCVNYSLQKKFCFYFSNHSYWLKINKTHLSLSVANFIIEKCDLLMNCVLSSLSLFSCSKHIHHRMSSQLLCVFNRSISWENFLSFFPPVRNDQSHLTFLQTMSSLPVHGMSNIRNSNTIFQMNNFLSSLSPLSPNFLQH